MNLLAVYRLCCVLAAARGSTGMQIVDGASQVEEVVGSSYSISSFPPRRATHSTD